MLPVKIEEIPLKKFAIGKITLNRPEKLNTLTRDMCQIMADSIRKWNVDPRIVCILIQGEGEKGFCAGGDVRILRETLLKGTAQSFREVVDFFTYEYFNDYQIHAISKPTIAFAHGITMGGGLGLINGCSYRVAETHTTFAMPEISIGFYPDVGATAFLGRLAKGVGLYLGLTGSRFGSTDALELGLVDAVVDQNEFANIKSKLVQSHWTGDLALDHEIVQSILFSTPKSKRQRTHLTEIQHHLTALARSKTLEEGFDVLEGLAAKYDGVAKDFTRLKSASPTSAKVIFRQFDVGARLSVRNAFLMEFNMSIQFSLRPDFAEGVRCVLVDKGATPTWSHKTFAEISDEDVSGHFIDPFSSLNSNPLLGNQPNPFPDLISSY